MSSEISNCPKCQIPLPGVEIGGKPYCPNCDAKMPPTSSISVEDLDLDSLLTKTTESAPAETPSVDKEEELRRLAAMVGHAGYDKELFQTKGRLVFSCPLCNCRLEVTAKRAGGELTCSGCTMEILAPDPITGVPAQPLHEADAASPALPKAVIPMSRKVFDKTLAEGQSGGRTKRTAPLPTGSKEVAGPGDLAPIPARQDQVMGPNIPTQRKDFGRGFFKKNEDSGEDLPGSLPSEPAPKSEPIQLPPQREEDPDRAGLQRFNEKRRDFLPRHNVEGDLEVVENWGVTEKRAPLSKKFSISAWAVVIIGSVGVGIWAMKEVFRDKTDLELKRDSSGELTSQAEYVHMGMKVLEDFFAAEKLEQRAKFVRFPQRTEAKMRKHYGHSAPPLKLERFDDTKEARIDGVDFLIGIASTSDGATHEVYLEIPEIGKPKEKLLKVDWESLVAYSDVKWDDFLRQELEEPATFRVIMQKDTYHNPPFEDTDRWVCFHIQQGDDVGKDYGFCFGYVDIATSGLISQIANPIRLSLESGGGGAVKARVKLSFTPQSRGRKNMVPQVKITEFSQDWLVVNPQ